MDQNLITAMAGVLGSVTGASAAIVTTWISQKAKQFASVGNATLKRSGNWSAGFVRAGNVQVLRSLLQKPCH